jgi:hypothetical protein
MERDGLAMERDAIGMERDGFSRASGYFLADGVSIVSRRSPARM